jgi:hypothetical protein
MYKKMNFFSGPGLKLTAIIENPPAAKGKKPGIVICNGPGGGKDGFLVEEVSHWLAKAGYVALRFDYRGIGDSDGPKNRLIPLEQAEDIRNALTFLQQQPGVDPARIGLWGAATGGANATYVAGIDQRVKCLVCVNGMRDLGDWLRVTRRYWEWLELLKLVDDDRARRVITGSSEQLETLVPPRPATPGFILKQATERSSLKRGLTLESVEAMINFKPETVVAKIAPRAAMWVCARLDTLLPIEHSVTMFEKAGEPKKLHIIEGVEHHALYSEKPFKEMMDASIAWLKEQL